MKKKALLCSLLLSVAMTAGTLFASQYDDSNGFMPKWQKGEEWVLEASHKDLKSDVAEWQAPIRWNFKVRNIKKLNGVECYVLHIHSTNKGVKDQAVLYLSTEDLRPVRVIDIYPSGLRMKHSVRDIDSSYAQPLLAEDTIVPYDLPVFPLESNSEGVRAQGAISDGINKIKDAFTKKFAKVRNVGGLMFKRTVTQKNVSPKTEKQNAAQGAMLRSESAPANNSPVYSVQLAEERTDNNLSQTWRKGYPWAVASSRRDRKVRLIKYSANNNGGNE